MNSFKAFLAEDIDGLGTGRADLIEYIDRICESIEMVDDEIMAFLPEPDRKGRLMREAARLKASYPDPSNRPPLYGIPVGVKDIFRVEGFPTRAGSRLPEELFEGPQSDAVSLLRSAGALILGKTVTTEFAYFEPGPTLNPHNTAHTPGGSSSGSAAAVAAGMCPLAIGTQTIGSIIRPAAFCGVVGFKPSYGRISTGGLIYCSRSADHVGFFTRDTAGLLAAAGILISGWKDRAGNRRWDVVPVLGVPEGPYLEQVPSEYLGAFEEQLKVLEEAGYSVRRVPALNDIKEISLRHRRMVASEMAGEHEIWFEKYGSLYRPRTAGLILEGRQVGREELAGAREGRFRLREELESAMKLNGIDLWVTPAALGPAPEGTGSTGDPAMSLPWTHAGMPAVSLPAGVADKGLPLGLQFVAGYMDDERLAAWSVSIEGALKKIAG
ncbi:MAG: amidase [Bacillota bacterium]